MIERPTERLATPGRRLLRTIVAGGVAIGACLAALVPGTALLAKSYAYQDTGVGKLRVLAQRSTVYDTSGHPIAQLGTQNREDVRLDRVPKILQNAVIAVEDKTFWTNDGVDLNGVVRAAVKNLSSGQITQGGSTITQQLVKQRILTSKRDVNRKVKELILALQLNNKYSKKQILEEYLNTVYFGQGSYGVKAAVERFFLRADPSSPYGYKGAELRRVTIGQAALLAGIINNPEGNNPFANPKGARIRRSVALQRMVSEGYITEAQAATADQEPLPTIKPPADLRPTNAWAAEVQNRLFTDPIYNLGKTIKERKDAVLRGGLKIYATEDSRLQGFAQNSVDRILSSPPGFTGSLVAIDPKTGEVKAMVGGAGFLHSQYNIATQYPGRQAGSTWKTITLATAMENGYSPSDMVEGTSPCAFGALGQTANNEPGGGTMSLRDATAFSVNCAFVRTELSLGFPKIMDMAHKLGITQNTLRPILTLTLGAVESTGLEMATVSATLAAEGVQHHPIFVGKIIGPAGHVIFDAKAMAGTRAISQDSADCETDLLQGVITTPGATGSGAALNGRPAAGKTGTTDQKTDANFLGFTPQLATFIWHGNPLGRIPGAGFGGQSAASAFKDFMDAALAGQPALPLPGPGPACNRPGAQITPFGRVVPPASPSAGAPTQVTPVRPSPPVVNNPPPAPSETAPPPLTSPPATTPPPTTPPPTTPPPTTPPPTTPPPTTPPPTTPPHS